MPNSSLAILALVSLVSGYYFASKNNHTKWKLERSEGRRLFFEAAYWAIWLSLISFTLVYLIINVIDMHSFLEILFPKRSTLEMSFYCSTALTFIMGHFLPLLFNQRDRLKISLKTIAKRDMPLESFLAQVSVNNQLIAISLKNRKYYVGWVLYLEEIKDPSSDFIRILPALSGYRKDDTLEPVFTASYIDIYEAIQQKEDQGGAQVDAEPKIPGHLSFDDFELVLPVSEITAVYPYILDIPQDMFAIKTDD